MGDKYRVQGGWHGEHCTYFILYVALSAVDEGGSECLIGVLVRATRRVAAYTATGLNRVFAIHSTASALTKKGRSPVRFPKRKVIWRGWEDRKGNSLACPIRAVCRWLPASNLTLSAEETRQTDCLPPPPRLLRLVIIGAAGSPFGSRLPFTRTRGFDLDWGKAILPASRTNHTGHAGWFTATGRGRGGWRGRGRRG